MFCKLLVLYDVFVYLLAGECPKAMFCIKVLNKEKLNKKNHSEMYPSLPVC